MNIIFTAEMVLRIISMGGIIEYLKHPWNIFDGIMVGGVTLFERAVRFGRNAQHHSCNIRHLSLTASCKVTHFTALLRGSVIEKRYCIPQLVTRPLDCVGATPCCILPAPIQVQPKCSSMPLIACPAPQVIAGYTTFIPMGQGGGSNLEGVRALRALRALRPLRTITR